MLRKPGWSEPLSWTQRQWLQQPMQQEPKGAQLMWIPQSTTTPYLIPQPQDLSMVPIFPAFNAGQGTTLGRIAPTTVALTAIEQLPDITNQSIQSKSVGYAERKNTLLPTALLTITGMTITSSRMRDMLGTESVTQGNKGGNITVFPHFLSFPYELIISPFTYGHNITWLPM